MRRFACLLLSVLLTVSLCGCGGTQESRLDLFAMNTYMVITAEGALDGQSPFGKVPCEVARRAEALGIPTVALAGTIGKGARQTYEHGIGAYASIMQRPCSLRKAIGGGAKLLRQAAENTMRMLLVGQRLAQRERA